MQIHNLVAFAFVAGLLTVTPGLDTAMVLRTAAVEGPRRAMMAALGIALGCLGWAAAASIGLGALVAASQFAYSVLRIAGGCYIVWLGGRMLWNAFTHAATGTSVTPQSSQGASHSWLVRGFLTNILNPKVGVFYVSFLPLFIPPHNNVMPFSMLLGLLHAVEGIVWFWLLTSVMKPLARWISRGNVTRWFDGIAGTALITFGGALLFERR